MLRPILFAAALVTAAPATAAGFDPVAFFSGPTRGEGTLKVVLKRSERFNVESEGRADGKGRFVLEQVIHWSSKPPKQRRWLLREVSPNNWVGSISDSPGPVRGRVLGNSLVLNYPVKGGLRAEQVMTPEGDGRTVRNHIVVRKLGIIVAKVIEIIRKLD